MTRPWGGWLRGATIEIRRCRANIAAGGPVGFWLDRLSAAAIEHEQAAESLRAEEKTLRERPRKPVDPAPPGEER